MYIYVCDIILFKIKKYLFQINLNYNEIQLQHAIL